MAKRGTNPNKKVGANTSSLMRALQFVKLAQKTEGTTQQEHCWLFNNWASATNGVISAGHPIEEELAAAPHTHRMIDALALAGENYAITQTSPTQLSVRAGKFGAFIDCVDSVVVQNTVPDQSIAPADDRLRAALAAVAPLASETAEQVHLASVLLRAGSAVGTNGFVLVEAWHGIDLPPDMVIPKSFVTALLSIEKPIVSFGWSGHSITFYFEDSSWIKTVLYQDKWPDVLPILECETNPFPLPKDFFTALEAVEKFSVDGFVYFDTDLMLSHDNVKLGAQFQCDGLTGGTAFSIRGLKSVKSIIKLADFKNPAKMMFFGENVRGAIAPIRR